MKKKNTCLTHHFLHCCFASEEILKVHHNYNIALTNSFRNAKHTKKCKIPIFIFHVWRFSSLYSILYLRVQGNFKCSPYVNYCCTYLKQFTNQMCLKESFPTSGLYCQKFVWCQKDFSWINSCQITNKCLLQPIISSKKVCFFVIGLYRIIVSWWLLSYSVLGRGVG